MFGLPAGGQRDADADQDRQAAADLPGGKPGFQPIPFDERGERGGQALNQQDGQAGAEARQGLEKRHIADANPKDTAEKEHRERIAFEPMPEAIGPKRKKEGGAGQAPEVRLGAADQSGGTMSANDGDRKEDGGEQRREHGANVKRRQAPRPDSRMDAPLRQL